MVGNSNLSSSCMDSDPSLSPCSSSSSPTPTPLQLQRVSSCAGSVVLYAEAAGVEAESRKLPSSQFKGVVPQPNGRWGTQIYEKHQRVWLGTFNLESEAAKAYDAAAQRFRGRDAVTNFKSLSESNQSDVAELEFLNSHSKAEIVDMLRKHTYDDELQQSKLAFPSSTSSIKTASSDPAAAAREHLFDKTVTPSDVGKLNRLVIPKQHAEKHFPLKTESKGLLLNFEDECGKVWRFRYSYWNSSQSYVLTKGWSRFVKEKKLEAGDVVSFYQERQKMHLYIECKSKVSGEVPVQVLRLFGVNILKLQPDVTHHQQRVGVKRSSRDLLLDHHHDHQLKFFKKQYVDAL